MNPSPEAIRQQLDRLLGSGTFSQAGRSRRFLEYIVTRALAGESERLKEYTVGVDVFERDACYEPGADAIVRVEAGRLRAKIRQYYAREGGTDPVLIDLPKGGYSPEFTCRDTVFVIKPDSQSGTRSSRGKTAMAITLGFLVGLAIVLFNPWPSAPDQSAVSITPAGITMTRIAVLPFATDTDDPQNLELAEKLTDKVTGELVRYGSLHVVPSTSAARFRDIDYTLQDIGRALQADMVLEARLIDAPGGIRVEARLSDTALHRKIWVDDSFNADDPVTAASHIASAAARQLSISL